jgi:hypothetical protein
MRKIATLRHSVDGILRVMLCTADGGTYLFLYVGLDDGPCMFDEWYETWNAAELAAMERFDVQATDWTAIDDPLLGAQHDWIRPTRVKCDSDGEELWRQFEAIPLTEQAIGSQGEATDINT